MLSRRVALLLTLSFLVGLCHTAPAGDPVGIGSRVSDLRFKDIRYLPRTLDDFGSKKAYVLVFTNTSCPIVQRYLPVLNRLDADYRAKGVQFVAVNVGPDDSIIDMATQAVQHECTFPFVKDFDQMTVKALGVERTPEVVVLDATKTIRYRGRIDDRYRLGGTRDEPTREDLKLALDAIVDGKEVEVKTTPVDGCAITPVEEVQVHEKVNYAEHVAPLLMKHCVACHHPGTPAPFSLQTYEQAAAKANAIAEVVHEGRMPPWYASPEHNDFINRRGMTSDEKAKLMAWAKAGKAPGDLSKAPAMPQELTSPKEWRIGEPDVIVSLPEHTLPADGDIPYKYEMLPHNFGGETWIQAMEIRPSNPRVVHHCNIVYVTPKDGLKSTNFITGTVPGSEPMLLDEGTAFKLPKDASMIAQIHYVSTGKPEKCQIKVGIKFARGTIDKQLHHYLLVDNKFVIPPGDPSVRVAASRTLQNDALPLALFVHMHLRGRDMTFIAHYPDGTKETLLTVPNYSFDWQMPYRWSLGQRKFPKGTRLEAIAHYDNSAFNAFNPDPKATVKDGLQTRDEMMNGFVFYYDANEKLGIKVDPKTGHVVE